MANAKRRSSYTSETWLATWFLVSGFCGLDTLAATVNVSPGQNLSRLIRKAPAGTTFVLHDGRYRVAPPIIIRQPNIIIRSATSAREKVILDGAKTNGPLNRKQCIPKLIGIRASNVTVQNLTLCHAAAHAIHIVPTGNGNLKNIRLRGLHVYDCGQQLIKVNSSGTKPPNWTDNCVLESSTLEFIDRSIMMAMGKMYYTGGIDIHGGRNWLIRNNTFRNIQRDEKVMEHAIHLWSASRDTVVENNRIINCFRGIGFGMKSQPKGRVRAYPDRETGRPYYDHIGGIIRNNMVFNDETVKLNSGIELNNVDGAKVVHNTVVSLQEPFSSIEIRWPNSNALLQNNLVSHQIRTRNQAKAKMLSNRVGVTAGQFYNIQQGDLRIKASALTLVNQAQPLTSELVATDFEGQARDDEPDIGADEFVP